MSNYKQNKHSSNCYKEGIIQGTPNGYAFLLTEEKDYFISNSDLKDANHKDKVLCTVTETKTETHAKVIKVLERGVDKIVGIYDKRNRGGVVVSSDKRYYNLSIVTGGIIPKRGEKVVLQIEGYNRNGFPFGKIEKVLGKEFEKQAEIQGILIENKIPLSFSSEVLAEAEGLAKTVTKKQKEGRVDFTNKLVITIDGEDAKDFDDAISIEKNANGYTLGVHIADVSEYVKLGGEVDKEAYKRGNSYYYPEFVIPMLPTVLCDNMCSLVENKVRLTLSCIIEIDNKGNIKSGNICKSFIRSKHRMTYNKVQKIIDNDSELCKKYADIVPLIKNAFDLYNLLKNKRVKNGMIDFSLAESKVIVNGNKIDITARKTLISEGIIEQFMITANQVVAFIAKQNDLPFVYRVHEKPTTEKVYSLKTFLQAVGLNFTFPNKISAKDYQNILQKTDNGALGSIIKRVMLRSMQKAKYLTQPLGHFGLSLEDYSHFTSPIRRYADLTVHRILKSFIENQNCNKYFDLCEQTSWKATEREKASLEAERAVTDYYKVLYMADKVGNEYEGIISGVTNFGIFVELPNTVEGLIKIENLLGNRYKLNKDAFILTNGINTYKLGQTLKIKVAGVNYGERRVEFLIANNKNIKNNKFNNKKNSKSSYKVRKV